MYDLLTVEEDKAAALLGWAVQYVFDLQRKKWTVQIFPGELGTAVVNMARQGDALAIKTLRLVANPVIRKGKK